MAKVHPNVAVPAVEPPARASSCGYSSGVCTQEEAVTLTVWRKSLLFNCKGFTVFDAKGNLLYRVDNYGSEPGAEVVLMDSKGRPVLTLRRKRLSLGDQWLVYAGEETRRPLYAVKRSAHMRSGKSMARVVPCTGGGIGAGGYDVEGSYTRRCCTVYDSERRAVAQVQQKEAVGMDVFRLVVQPEIDASLGMAVVVALDQMFGKPSLLRSWSSQS